MSFTFFPANVQTQQLVVQPVGSKDMDQVKPFDGSYHVLMGNVEAWQRDALKYAVNNEMPLKVSKKSFKGKTIFYTLCGDNYNDALAISRSIVKLMASGGEEATETRPDVVDTLCFAIEDGDLVITKKLSTKYTKQYLLSEAKCSKLTMVCPNLYTQIEIIALLDVGSEEGYVKTKKLQHMAAVTKAGKLILVDRAWKRFSI